MQRSGRITPTQQNVAPPFFNTAIWGTSNSNVERSDSSNSNTANNDDNSSRPSTSTSHGDHEQLTPKQERSSFLSRGDRGERKISIGGRRSASFSSPIKGRRRASSNTASGLQFMTDAAIPPALPEFALAAARQVSRDSDVLTSPTDKKMSRGAPTPTNGYHPTSTTPPSMLQSLQPGIGQSESHIIYQHIQEIANKRISTLDYLRKAHEGRVYWFNTLLFDKPDLARMAYFDSRKLARRATNYLLLGLSIPTVIDLNSSTPLEFLRSLNTLLTEFESFQQIHTENGTNASSLSRARLPQMFRRGPAGKGRRTSGAGDLGGYLDGGANGSMSSNGGANQTPTAVMTFGLGGEGNDLLPGEEYTHLLTPSLPFDPDFFETFATLCDALIDAYTRLISLVPGPQHCTAPVAELFGKADARVRKIIIQGVVKEFEDTSRAGLRQEISSVGKTVLGGLM